MEYKGYTVVVAAVGVQDTDRWQSIYSVHKPSENGLHCVYRCAADEPYDSEDAASDAGYEAARDWIDKQCRIN